MEVAFIYLSKRSKNFTVLGTFMNDENSLVPVTEIHFVIGTPKLEFGGNRAFSVEGGYAPLKHP